MSPFIGEYLGTLLLILLGNGVVANVVLTGTKGNNSGWIVITTAWGLATFVAVVVAGPYSGAHLNPAVTLALAATGKFPWSSVLPYIEAQFLGAFSGMLLVWLIYADHFKQTKDPDTIRAVFCTRPAIRNYWTNMASEIIGAFVLIFTIFYFKGAEIESTKTLVGLGSIGALPVAFLVWAIGLSLGGTTGYAINPVRDLGPRIIHWAFPIQNKSDSDWSYSWVPIAGPLVGAGIAVLLYLNIS